MPTIKIWNIKGNGGKSSTNSLKDSISYIKDSKNQSEMLEDYRKNIKSINRKINKLIRNI